jgi:hypothetical protein
MSTSSDSNVSMLHAQNMDQDGHYLIEAHLSFGACQRRVAIALALNFFLITKRLAAHDLLLCI